jgi:hypothetical protein
MGQIAGHRHRGSGGRLSWCGHVCWGGLVDAADLARRFALGRAARLSDGPVARGKQGLVWRLETADGSWAVKMPFDRSSEDEVRLATAFQEAACTAGVPAPRVRRTTGGCVFASIEGRQVRVYEWVDLQAPDARLDPERVGAVVACRHRRTDRSLTRSSAAIITAGTRCSNLLTASSRTSSRRLRPSAVSPPPCAYRMHPAYRRKLHASAQRTSPIKDLSVILVAPAASGGRGLPVTH